MTKYSNFNNEQKNKLYTNVLLLCRNKLFYTNLNLIDTFHNRIILIFIHISFIFIKIKQDNQKSDFKIFSQEMFDLIFNKIDINMREIGYGDTTVNKNMKFLIKSFYDILLNCEKYRKMSLDQKGNFLIKYLKLNIPLNKANNKDIIDYFDKYESFCFDLSSDSVLKGEIIFNYK